MNTYDFFVNGYIQGHFAEIDNYDFSEFVFLDCSENEDIIDNNPTIDKKAQKYLSEIYNIIFDRHLSKLFPNIELLEKSMWQGIDTKSKEWHTDYMEKKNFNSNLLLYLDDNYGNNIQVKNQTEEFTIYPIRGDFIWLNQNKIFQHRAKHITGPRRLISYEMYIPELI